MIDDTPSGGSRGRRSAWFGASLTSAALPNAAPSEWGLFVGVLRLMLLAVLVIVAVMVLAWLLRWVLTRRLLRTRVSFRVHPSESFDPKPEHVEAFCRQLTSVPRQTRNWLTRPASAVRVRFEARPGGQMEMTYQVPRRSGEALRAAASVFDEVEIHGEEE